MRKTNIAVLCLIVVMVATMFGPGTTTVKAESANDDGVLWCPIEDKPCNFLTEEDLFALRMFAVLADKDPFDTFVKYKDGAWMQVYETVVFPSNGKWDNSVYWGVLPNTIPTEIKFGRKDYLSIPQMGVSYQNGKFLVWEPEYFSSGFEEFPFGIDLSTNLWGNPRTHTLEQEIQDTDNDKLSSSYFKVTSDMTIVYNWDVVTSFNDVTISISSVYIQVSLPELRGYHPMDLPKDAEVLTKDQTRLLGLERGSKLYVKEVYTQSVQYAKFPWNVLFQSPTYVELELDNDTTFIVAYEDMIFSYPLDCSSDMVYYPRRGDVLWVRGIYSARPIELSIEKPYRRINSDEDAYLRSLLATGDVVKVKGKIFAEMFDGSEFSFSHYFIFDDGKTRTTYNISESSVPPVNTEAYAYVYKTGGLFALSDLNGYFWYFTPENSGWRPSMTCNWN